MINSSPVSVVVTVVIAVLGVGVGLVIGYLLRAPAEGDARSGLPGRLTPLRLIKPGNNDSVSDMFKQCRKTAGEDPAIIE